MIVGAAGTVTDGGIVAMGGVDVVSEIGTGATIEAFVSMVKFLRMMEL